MMRRQKTLDLKNDYRDGRTSPNNDQVHLLEERRSSSDDAAVLKLMMEPLPQTNTADEEDIQSWAGLDYNMSLASMGSILSTTGANNNNNVGSTTSAALEAEGSTRSDGRLHHHHAPSVYRSNTNNGDASSQHRSMDPTTTNNVCSTTNTTTSAAEGHHHNATNVYRTNNKNGDSSSSPYNDTHQQHSYIIDCYPTITATTKTATTTPKIHHFKRPPRHRVLCSSQYSDDISSLADGSFGLNKEQQPPFLTNAPTHSMVTIDPPNNDGGDDDHAIVDKNRNKMHRNRIPRFISQASVQFKLIIVFCVFLLIVACVLVFAWAYGNGHDRASSSAFLTSSSQNNNNITLSNGIVMNNETAVVHTATNHNNNSSSNGSDQQLGINDHNNTGDIFQHNSNHYQPSAVPSYLPSTTPTYYPTALPTSGKKGKKKKNE